MSTAQKRRREARAAQNLVRLLEVAAKAGFEVDCRHDGDAVTCLVMLEEWGTYPRRSQVGTVRVRVGGPYCGDGHPDQWASHVSGVGCTLALRAKLLTRERVADYLPLGENSEKEQQRWFDRADAEKARRAAYAAKLDGAET